MTSPTESSARHLLARDGAVLLLLTILMAVVRAFSYHEPPEWDIGTYLVVGHELNAGERLYHDIWDTKPPGVFVTYALAERIAGYGPRQTYLLSLVAAWATLVAVYATASVRGRAAGLWAATFWACAGLDPMLGANLPNTEVFINACVAGAVALLVRMEGPGMRWRRVIAIGLLLAAASFYKQVAVAPAALLAVAHVVCPPRGASRRTALAQMVVVAAIGVLAWAGLFGYFSLTGRAWIFWQTTVVYPQWYGGDLLQNILASLAPSKLLPPDMRFVIPLIVAALLAFLPRAGGSSRRPGALLVAAAVGVQLAIAWPGHFYDHYYQFWLPVLSIAAGWGIVRLGDVAKLRRNWLAAAVGAALAFALLQPQFSWFTVSPKDWAHRKHEGFFVRSLNDAEEMISLLEPGETVYTWSDEAWFYYLARRRVPAAGLWKQHTLEGPLADWLARRTVEDLDRDPPTLFVDWVELPSPPDHPITQWFAPRYVKLEDGKTRWPFVVYVLRGSGAEHRLGRRPLPHSDSEGRGDQPQHVRSPSGRRGGD